MMLILNIFIDIFNYFGFVKSYGPYRKKVMDIITFFL